jgi:hypothetical protein
MKGLKWERVKKLTENKWNNSTTTKTTAGMMMMMINNQIGHISF